MQLSCLLPLWYAARRFWRSRGEPPLAAWYTGTSRRPFPVGFPTAMLSFIPWRSFLTPEPWETPKTLYFVPCSARLRCESICYDERSRNGSGPQNFSLSLPESSCDQTLLSATITKLRSIVNLPHLLYAMRRSNIVGRLEDARTRE